MKRRKLLVICMAMIMILVGILSGCKKVEDKTDDVANKPASDTKTEEKNTEDTEEEEPYEFKIFANFAPVEMSNADQKFWQGLEEALNLKIEFEVPPSGNYTERKQIMLAGGDYPELVLFDSSTDKAYIDSVRNGIILPINDLLENAPNVVKYSYDVSFDSFKTMNDDNIYGIPRTSVARADGFILRKDWLDAVGITDVEDGGTISRDKLTEMLTAFTFDDPDGNGVNDTYGYKVSADSNGNIEPLFGWSFGLIGWQKYGDNYIDLKYSQNHDNFKQALAYSSMLWEKGVLDPDWPTLNNEVAWERTFAGTYGLASEFAGWLFQQEEKMRAFNPDAELIYVTGIEDNEGTVVGGSFSTGAWGQWCIMNSAEKPERIMDMLDYSLSDAYWDNVKFGPEGVTWNNEGGKMVPTEEYPEYAWGRRYLRRNDDPDFFVTLNASDENRTRLKNLIGKCIDQAVFSKDKGFRPAIADDQAFIDAETELNNTISKIIVGDLTVDDWDQALQDWYDAGGAQYVQEMNDHIMAKN